MSASTPTSNPLDQAAYPVKNKGLLTLAVMGATIIQILDSTIANVAIPHMQTSLGATMDTITWVLKLHRRQRSGHAYHGLACRQDRFTQSVSGCCCRVHFRIYAVRHSDKPDRDGGFPYFPRCVRRIHWAAFPNDHAGY